MHAIQVTATSAAVLTLIFIALSCYVSWLRVSHKVSLGDHGDRTLNRAMRAHGNFAEHIPIALLLMLLLELSGGHPWVLIGCGIALVAGRILHAWGLLSRATTVRRQLGALFTYVAQLVLAVCLLIQLFA